MSTSIRWAEEKLWLRPERAVYWPRQATLFVADLHLGKDATFRAAGIGLPPGSAAKDLARLSATLTATGAERLVILGDFFHARPGRTAETHAAIAAWRARHNTLAVVLVRGNHDRHAGEPLAEWRIASAGESFALPPFVCHHEPLPYPSVDTGYVLAGHVHPVFALRGSGGDGLRWPCFFFGSHQAILPAFSGFTGGQQIRPQRGDRIFVVGPDGVYRVT